MTDMELLRMAGRERRQVRFLYHGSFRHVEPYSFREGRDGVLLFGYQVAPFDPDHDPSAPKAFKLGEVTQLSLLSLEFAPRWPVELK